MLPMSEDRTTRIKAVFETREAADLAIEHLVQEHNISRPDIFVQSISEGNSAGVRPSGADLSHESENREDGALGGEIEVSADISANQVARFSVRSATQALSGCRVADEPRKPVFAPTPCASISALAAHDRLGSTCYP